MRKGIRLNSGDNGRDAQANDQQTEPVLDGKYDRIVVHLATKRKHPDTADPVQQQAEQYPERLLMTIERADIGRVHIESEHQDCRIC